MDRKSVAVVAAAAVLAVLLTCPTTAAEAVGSTDAPLTVRSGGEAFWRSGRVYGKTDEQGVPTWHEVDLYEKKESQSRDGRSFEAHKSSSSGGSSCLQTAPPPPLMLLLILCLVAFSFRFR